MFGKNSTPNKKKQTGRSTTPLKNKQNTVGKTDTGLGSSIKKSALSPKTAAKSSVGKNKKENSSPWAPKEHSKTKPKEASLDRSSKAAGFKIPDYV
jgi:hypothetical protein